MTQSCIESLPGDTSNFAARLMTLAAAHVPDSSVGVEKCMAILAGTECQFQNAEVSVNLDDGIGRESAAHAAQITATSSRYDLRKPLCGVSNAARCLW
jgi:hypothetical protein